MNSVFDLCMFYSAVASIFVLFCILFNQTSTKTALNSVSYYLCLMLLCHSVAISCYSLVTICFFEYNLESIAHFKLLRAVFGFVMGFFSFSYPYVIFSLIRYFIKGKKPLNGFLGRNTFFLYVVTALLYIIGAYFDQTRQFLYFGRVPNHCCRRQSEVEVEHQCKYDRR